jgi:hypothetical protein
LRNYILSPRRCSFSFTGVSTQNITDFFEIAAAAGEKVAVTDAGQIPATKFACSFFAIHFFLDSRRRLFSDILSLQRSEAPPYCTACQDGGQQASQASRQGQVLST